MNAENENANTENNGRKCYVEKSSHIDGANLIKEERLRQVTHKGYDADHDDHHMDGQLAMAACCYASPKQIFEKVNYKGGYYFVDPWPFDQEYDKRYRFSDGEVSDPAGTNAKGRIELLTKAGALIAAEIDRLIRIKEGA